MYNHFWPQPTDYLQDVSVLERFRSRILHATIKDNQNETGPRRIFLTRPPEKRGYNQDEIEKIAKDRGFTSVRPETLSFAEQVRLFHRADVVIGPTGAAWAGSLFMQPNAKGLIWALEEFSGGCFFSNLSLVSGSDTSYQFVKTDPPINNTLDAHCRVYNVPVAEFTRNLDTICSEKGTVRQNLVEEGRSPT